MSLKTIIATLILGTSSVALAQPAVRDHRASVSVQVAGGFGFGGNRPVYQPSYQQPVYQQPVYEQPRPTYHINSIPYRQELQNVPELIAAASQMSLSNDGYAQTGVDSSRRYSRLVFEGFGGQMTIDRVELKMTDGTIRTFRVGARLDERNPSITLDLGFRDTIGFMTVYGKSATRTSLQVSGLR